MVNRRKRNISAHHSRFNELNTIENNNNNNVAEDISTSTVSA